ncbi:MAG: hypothetical protein IM553_18725 [Microcystis sp. M57BS1]|nr:hypothetical protein [Microcystis sp. M63BS1]MCA2536366.1 hypothetical protein [Microcystis sp. M57BS1]MCA2575785.1 hypothetical protein [Microcystis sp. M41BS1]
MLQPNLRSSEKVFRGDRVWGFTGFEVANYLNFQGKSASIFCFYEEKTGFSEKPVFCALLNGFSMK